MHKLADIVVPLRGDEADDMMPRVEAQFAEHVRRDLRHDRETPDIRCIEHGLIALGDAHAPIEPRERGGRIGVAGDSAMLSNGTPQRIIPVTTAFVMEPVPTNPKRNAWGEGPPGLRGRCVVMPFSRA